MRNIKIFTGQPNENLKDFREKKLLALDYHEKEEIYCAADSYPLPSYVATMITKEGRETAHKGDISVYNGRR